MSKSSFVRFTKHYLVVCTVLLAANSTIAYFHYRDLLNDVLIAQAYLIVLFGLFTGGTVYVRRKLASHQVIFLVALLLIKMALALAYLLPIVLGEHKDKDTIALFFMINYLIYLNLWIVSVVRNQ